MSDELTRSDHWRQQYRKKRYLKHAKKSDLDRRAGDLLTNIVTLTPSGQVGAHCQGGNDVWLERWTHVQEEFALRFGPYPAGFSKDIADAAQLPVPTYPDVPPGAALLANLKIAPGSCLLWFNRFEHVEDALTNGRLRIAPASSYGDPSLNMAVHDNELRFEAVAPSGSLEVAVLDPLGGEPIPLGFDGELKLTHTLHSDYYVYCLSTAAEHRLFDDFGANACLLIREPREFIARLKLAAKEVLSDWRIGGGPVVYVDPYFTDWSKLHIPLTKHFRFSYQWEYRLYWMHEAPQTVLEPVFVELSSLSDIAAMVQLPPRP